nr:bifunctional phosphoribosylaminoimidazolecarboxamide formyltransferase/IMP cyclohydrolase [bacterium]
MRAILSVSDKTGIVDFARGLHEAGVEIISTGGTAKAIQEAGIPVIGISDITGFPECLDGRVKTLHPAIHAGVLAMRSNPEHMRQIDELGVTPIDIVAINLYPFKATIQKEGVSLEEAIENIDIGGPTMLRAAAKNWQDVAAIVDPADYTVVLEEMKNGGISRETRFRLCGKVFEHTAAYDALITNYLNRIQGIEFPRQLTVTFDLKQSMRYGENPHQHAAFYSDALPVGGTLPQARQLGGKELSYNNINDANGALELLREFADTPAVVAVKHANPCGVGTGGTVYECYKMAYDADPVSIFGGIVVTNQTIDEATAKEMAKIFLEIIIAPAYTPEAVAVLTKKKNLRVLELKDIVGPLPAGQFEMRKVMGGLLVQERNTGFIGEELKVVTDRAPTEKELQDAYLAWKIVKHTKSNGIAVAKDGHSLGIGPGQVNRIWATQQALERSGEAVRGAAMASDAFFPFDDCVEAAGKAGITCIIQPGGSVRDEDSIKKANEYGIAMVFTGMRHFKH